MEKVLQTGLSLGMSATSGIHSSKPNRAPREFDGKNIMPPSYCPTAKDRVVFPAKNGKVEASHICIGAWPWGDKSTWHYKEEEFPAIEAAWRELYDAGINFIDTAQAYGSGESERLVGKLVKGVPRDSYVIQTKWLGTALDAKNYVLFCFVLSCFVLCYEFGCWREIEPRSAEAVGAEMPFRAAACRDRRRGVSPRLANCGLAWR